MTATKIADRSGGDPGEEHVAIRSSGPAGRPNGLSTPSTGAAGPQRWTGARVLLGVALVGLAVTTMAVVWLTQWSGLDRDAAIEAQPPLDYMLRYFDLEFYGNVIGFGAFLGVAALVVWLDRRNPFGWLLGGGVVAWMIANVLFVILAAIVDRNPTSPVLPYLAWTGVACMMAFPAMLTSSLGFFPNGTITAQGWWRRVLQCLLVVSAALIIGARFLPGPVATDPSDPPFDLDNPFGFGPADSIFSLELAVMAVAMLSVFSIASVVTTYLRSGPEIRHQIKWIVVGLPIFVGGAVLASVIDTAWETVPAGVGITVFAGLFAVAVTKRNLYGVDIVISRALVFAALATFIGLVYVSVVVGIGSLLDQGDEPNTVLSVAATAIVAVAFQPVRRNMERVANRVVFGRRATPYEVLSDFSRRVAATSQELLADVARSLADGTRAERVTVSVTTGGESLEAAAWPDQPIESPRTFSFPIRDGEDELGSLDLQLAAGQELAEQDHRLAAQLASGMGLALRNQLLTERLELRVDDLRGSRRRLVALQDETRRRIERDLHDGAQQQLVALKVKLGLGRAIAAKEGATDTAGTLERLSGQADEAVEAMREFARGVYPPLLEAEGLTVAIGAQARRAPIPVSMTAEDIDRLPREIESTVYFCVLEALRNTVRHAEATSATIRLAQPNGAVVFEVADDGRGFDPNAPYGTGLTAIADRLDVLTGTLAVESGTGRGTRLVGTVPAGEERELEGSTP